MANARERIVYDFGGGFGLYRCIDSAGILTTTLLLLDDEREGTRKRSSESEYCCC